MPELLQVEGGNQLETEHHLMLSLPSFDAQGSLPNSLFPCSSPILPTSSRCPSISPVSKGLDRLCLAAQSCPTLCDLMDCGLPGSSVHRDSPGKNNGVGCHALLQGIFPTQGLNPGLLQCWWILYQQSHQGSPVPAWLESRMENRAKG